MVNVYLVNPSTPDNVKYNIFKRINTGGLALEAQEIRNALFQGKATQFLQNCAGLPCFVEATGGSVKSERMLDREFVLRYVSFCYLDLNLYSGNIDDFLNEGMKYLNRAGEEELEKIEEEFKSVMLNMYNLMGRNTFRKICYDGRRRPINKVIYESWCYVIKNLPQPDVNRLIKYKEKVQKKYMDLCEKAEYLYLLKAPDKKALYLRIDCIMTLVKSILENVQNDKEN